MQWIRLLKILTVLKVNWGFQIDHPFDWKVSCGWDCWIRSFSESILCQHKNTLVQINVARFAPGSSLQVLNWSHVCYRVWKIAREIVASQIPALPSLWNCKHYRRNHIRIDTRHLQICEIRGQLIRDQTMQVVVAQIPACYEIVDQDSA